MGVIAYELLHARTPFGATNIVELMHEIQTPIRLPRNLSPGFTDFLNSCLQFHERDRIGWDQVFEHPLFSAQ